MARPVAIGEFYRELSKQNFLIWAHFRQFYRDSCRNRVTVANLAKIILMLAGTQMCVYTSVIIVSPELSSLSHLSCHLCLTSAVISVSPQPLHIVLPEPSSLSHLSHPRYLTCVVFPEPVSPEMRTTLWSLIALVIFSLIW